MLHELFHRIQPDLGLMTISGNNAHLDTVEGRVWLRLEWRALARALDPFTDVKVWPASLAGRLAPFEAVAPVTRLRRLRS